MDSLSRPVALGAVGLASTGLIPVLLSVAAASARCLLELPPAWWGATQLSAALTAITCTIGAMGAAWHLVSVALALIAGGVGPRTGRGSAATPGTGPGLRGAAAHVLNRWGAPLVRRLAAGVVIAGLATSPAVAATETDTDDLGWQPTVNATQTPDAEATAPGVEATAPGVEASVPDVEPSAPDAAPATPDSESDPPSPTAEPADAATSHRVKAGESLWAITAKLLGPDASPADIAAAWPQLYRANTETIGTDPGLIRPGAVLTIPTFTES
ncbi:LysM peptidoglycan-binding domain-containing protein [Actinomyces sp. MRS3W]|uniref:LysM peptidoglycan-binding domain-containing protein n=1 Tax=Actinomyces sp. MRS3W TaxID=2800796 RepID=UPI0028FD9CF6|nr:LysM peptidoglycan-binding domain-containing protein [Actinomyces sp. MRS3W]MDU0349825.1 LysM peptidoglycan-binding domain-containing protein [Actinomyces sp. MRS3W]